MKLSSIGNIAWGVFALSASMLVAGAVVPREPHFPEIVKPPSGYVLHTNGQASGSFEFLYSDGMQYDENITVTVALDGGDHFPRNVATHLPFAENSAEACITISFTEFGTNDYTLWAEEFDSSGTLVALRSSVFYIRD